MVEQCTKKESKCEIENSHDLNTICFLFPRRMYGIMFCSSSIVVELTEFGRKKRQFAFRRDNRMESTRTKWRAYCRLVAHTHAVLYLSIYCIGFHRSNDIKNVSIMLFCFVSFRSFRYVSMHLLIVVVVVVAVAVLVCFIIQNSSIECLYVRMPYTLLKTMPIGLVVREKISERT